MSNLPLEVIEMLGQTMAKVAPIVQGLEVLWATRRRGRFRACRVGAPAREAAP